MWNLFAPNWQTPKQHLKIEMYPHVSDIFKSVNLSLNLNLTREDYMNLFQNSPLQAPGPPQVRTAGTIDTLNMQKVEWINNILTLIIDTVNYFSFSPKLGIYYFTIMNELTISFPN